MLRTVEGLSGEKGGDVASERGGTMDRPPAAPVGSGAQRWGIFGRKWCGGARGSYLKVFDGVHSPSVASDGGALSLSLVDVGQSLRC
jgi:hypothetical protein